MVLISKYYDWTTEEICPCMTHDELHRNYVARIDAINDNGVETRTYMERSDMPSLYYNVSPLCAGDIIVASLFNPIKNKQTKRYYVVEDNTEHSITLRGGDKNGTFNTYDKARKSLSATSTLADMVANVDPLKVNALFH